MYDDMLEFALCRSLYAGYKGTLSFFLVPNSAILQPTFAQF
jgi:hypothetical protein